MNSLRVASDAGAGGARGGAAGALLQAAAPLLLSCPAGAGRCGAALAADLLHDILDNNQVSPSTLFFLPEIPSGTTPR